MSIPNFIESGIVKIGNQGLGYRDYENLAYHKKSKPVLLHTGEIVLGSIVQIYSENEAAVKLPSGVLRAVLQGKLMQGDSLFFKVVENEPSLVLKIHSVNVKFNGKLLSLEEILRILNLPQNSMITLIAEFFKSRKSILVRDDILLINNFINSCIETDFPLTDINTVLAIINYHTETSEPLSGEVLKKIKPLLVKEEYFYSLLEEIRELCSSVYNPNGESIGRFFKTIVQPTFDLSILSGTFSKKITSENENINFLHILRNIYFDNEISNQKLYKAYNLIKLIVETIDSYNIIALRNALPMMFFIPVGLGKDYRIGRLFIRKKKEVETNFIADIFVMYFDYNEFGNLMIIGKHYESTLEVQLVVDSNEKKTKLEKNMNSLVEFIEIHGLTLKTALCVTRDEFSQKPDTELLGQKIRNISFVV